MSRASSVGGSVFKRGLFVFILWGGFFYFLIATTAFSQTNAVWDANTNATADTGGSATWNGTILTWTTNNGASFFAATNGNYNYQFGGTAGTVSLGANVAGNSLNFTTSGYMLASSGARTLAATNGITLADNVNLIIRPNNGNSITFSGTGITGGAGSSLTLGDGNSTYTNTILFSGGTIGASAPISVNIGANSRLSFGSSSSSGLTVNSTIVNNSASGTALTITNGASGNVLFNGGISGSNGLALVGTTSTSGKIILAASNSYAGGTTISTVGQVNYSNSAAFGSGAITIAGAGTNYVRSITAVGTQNITNSVTINSGSILQLSHNGGGTVNDTWSGNIGGAGSLQLGTGSTLYLTSTNSSFSGSYASISSGTTYLTKIGMAGENSSIGTNGTILVGGTAATSPTTFRWTGSGNEVSDKLFQLVGNNGLDLRANGANDSSLTINGNINAVTATSRTNLFSGYNGNTLTINGLINEVAGGTNNLTVGQSSSGTVVLGNTNNSFSGAVRITQSTAGQTTRLQTANIGNSGANSTLGKSGIINIGSTNTNAQTSLIYTGSGETTDKTINLVGTVGGALIANKGSALLKFTAPVTATGVGTKTLYADQDDANGVTEFAGEIPDSSGGTTELNKNGAGTLILSGINTFTGGFTLKGGTLELRNAQSLAPGNALTVPSNANVLPRVKVAYAGAGLDLGNLLVQADATIDLGTDNTAEIRFGSAKGWTAGKILTVAKSTGGGKMYILSPTELDLSQIKSLENPTWPASIDANGLVTFTAPTPSGTTFTSWLEGTTATDELLLQYAFGAGSVTQPVARAYLPQASVTGGNLVLNYYVRQGTQGLDVVPELSTNLTAVNGGFAPSDPISPSITDAGHEISDVGGVSVQRRTATVPIESGAAKKFLRVRVTQN
jgi:autotransporter-associated beta strand protein